LPPRHYFCIFPAGLVTDVFRSLDNNRLNYLLDYNRNNGKNSLKKAGLALSILLMSHYNTLIVVAGLLAAAVFFIFQKKKPVREYLLFFLFFSFCR